MEALIKRLEAAETGSVELDYLIREAFSEWRNIGGGWAAHKVTGERRCNHFDGADPVTTSVDAALALAERLFPGEFWVCEFGGSQNHVELKNARFIIEGSSASASLAVCIAVLKAKALGGDHAA